MRLPNCYLLKQTWGIQCHCQCAAPMWHKQKTFPLLGTDALWDFAKAGNSLPFSEAADSPMLADMGRETVYKHGDDQVWLQYTVHSLAPGRSECDYNTVILNLHLLTGICQSPYENCVSWVPRDLTDGMSTLTWLAAWWASWRTWWPLAECSNTTMHWYLLSVFAPISLMSFTGNKTYCYYSYYYLAQVMAWCHQATGHHLSQCGQQSISSNDITRPQWVNLKVHIHDPATLKFEEAHRLPISVPMSPT